LGAQFLLQEKEELLDENFHLREEIKVQFSDHNIVGVSGAFRHVVEQARRVPSSTATVLIHGETGTGKELIARLIHDNSPRANKPMISVNCGALSESLLESELFGHVKGAFTGATENREGRFALADSGTLFLDEVGDLPVDLQVKLLRVLQEGEFEPVGSSQTRYVDVRVIAATNRDLDKAMEQGQFREDLYYRLNVFPIALPPLRARGDDIVLLATAFAERFAQRMGRTIEALDDDACRRLKAYSWPGNVRELENVIERAVITARDCRLNLDRALPEAAGSAVLPAGDGALPRLHTADELRVLERENLVRALEAADWKVAGKNGAAQLLGMPPSTLASRMKALGIQRPG